MSTTTVSDVESMRVALIGVVSSQGVLKAATSSKDVYIAYKTACQSLGIKAMSREELSVQWSSEFGIFDMTPIALRRQVEDEVRAALTTAAPEAKGGES